MFRVLGNTVSRAWPVFLIVWALIVGLAFWLAPAWTDVALDRTFAFLPDSTISRRGEVLFKKAFPAQMNPSSVALLFTREDRVLTEQDKAFIEKEVRSGLERIAEKEIGTGSREPDAVHKKVVTAVHAFNDPGGGPLLVSEDQHATVVILELSTELFSHRNWPIMAGIHDLLQTLRAEKKFPAGLEINLTGNAAIGYDVSRAQADSAGASDTGRSGSSSCCCCSSIGRLCWP